jgi:hypothetical protein
MKKEKTKQKSDKAESTGFECDPRNFQGMFEKMNKCFTGEGGFPDCSAMMDTMKGQSCCGPIAEKAKKASGRETKNNCC